MRVLVALVLVILSPRVPARAPASAPVPAPASAPVTAPAAGRWVRPVGGPVVDPFRAPAHPYGPGHRGVTFAAVAGTPVRAAGAGRVAFVGTIAGVTWVALDHPGGLRTTYGRLGEVAVVPGQWVEPGAAVATVGPGGRLHLGLRRDGTYLDPMRLFVRRIRLVPYR